ncbi:hypothetical protein B9Z65_4927 [Elsinoe australis]|uniref:Transcription factor tau subunit sfc6 n=1 Tax=Elsinoe australis TaxID=40998 RepID=A0A2P8A6E8_9PEZI|nr:hypothetical protein B9Z65_4927 [Elsinoe australis]
MADSVRKSGRKRQPSGKVSVDPFAGLDISDDEAFAVPQDDDDSGDDFVAPPADEEIVSEDERMDDEADFAADAGELEDDYFDADMDVMEEEPPTPRKAGRPRKGKTSAKPVPLATTQRASRGLHDPRTRGSKESIRLFYYGPAEEDQGPAMQNVYRWRDEPLLPSRKPDRSGFGGYHRTFYEKEADRKREMENDWKWYDEEGGKETFQQLQQCAEIDEVIGKLYVPEDHASQDIVMGPHRSQQPFTLPVGGSLDLNEPFQPKVDGKPVPIDKSLRRSGWLLNVGDKVQTLAWAPNQGADYQYIALATMPLRNATDAKFASTFRPQLPEKAIIQIWEMKRRSDGYIDQSVTPKLRQVICTDHGDIRLLKWCIAPRKDEPETADGKHLGLLAGLWGDGHIRILDITLPPADSIPQTQYLLLTNTAFSSRPPSSVFSSFCWVSSHALIGSTSTGSIALFSLPTSLSADPATPLLSSPLQSTYITSLTTCYPSRPHILISAGLSGHLSMTDLSRVTTSSGLNPINTVLGPRSRISRQVITWHDWSQMVLSVDDNASLQGLPLRRFFGYTGLSRFDSSVLSLAASECHPFVAAGQVGGQVTTTNVMRRVLSTKEMMVAGRWFLHTWRRGNVPIVKIPGVGDGEEGMLDGPGDHDEIMGGADDGVGESSGVAGDDTGASDDAAEEGGTEKDKGLVRIVEGFKAEEVMLLKPGDERNVREGGLYTTIHEPQTGVTQVAWNPNLQCGGWIAAGTGSGLLRIEDVGTP